MKICFYLILFSIFNVNGLDFVYSGCTEKVWYCSNLSVIPSIIYTEKKKNFVSVIVAILLINAQIAYRTTFVTLTVIIMLLKILTV